MIKTGDIVYCKQTRSSDNTSLAYPYNTKGKYYKILDVKSDLLYITCDKNIYHISCQYRNSNDNDPNFFHFRDFFITIKELRKRKIIELNREY